VPKRSAAPAFATLRVGLEQLRIAQIHTITDLGTSFMEVRGHLVIRQARRLSDYLNHPDPMLELDGGEIRLQGQELWDEVQGLSLNRNRVLVVLPIDEDDPGADPSLLVPGRHVRVKIVCRGVQVTGFATVPMQATISSFIHESRARFLAVSDARLMPTPNGFQADPGLHPFCLVNRNYIVACVEAAARPIEPVTDNPT